MKSFLRALIRRILLYWLFLLLPVALLAQEHLDENFKGSYRKKPKTSIVRTKGTNEISPPKKYSSLSDLLGDLPPDVKMRKTYPDLRIHGGDPATRKMEELHNVEVDCWIHAVKWEGGKGDRDFHVIVGDDADREAATFMNVEISGLPASGKNRAPLRDARKQFLKLFPDKKFTTSFKMIDPPLKVRITGSLFFDGEHSHSCDKCPGPKDAKPGTVWEIHPVYSIVVIQ